VIHAGIVRCSIEPGSSSASYGQAGGRVFDQAIGCDPTTP
jgi:hypothetical protein